MKVSRASLGSRCGGAYAREAVHLPAAERGGVLDRLAHALLEFLYPVRVAADPTLARGPVAARQVVQHLRQSMLLQQLGDPIGGIVVGEQVLHSLETGVCRCGKAVHEVELAPEEAQVRG
jgi:hypothetical protein